MELLTKTKSHLTVTWRLIKKINNVKEDRTRKTNSNFHFSQAPAYAVLIRSNVI